MGTRPGPATDEIRNALAERTERTGVGAVGFDEFMALALYGNAGFYTNSDAAVAGGAGRRGGDFLTSPEVGPLFGAVVARYVDAQWERLGRPADFTVVDAGAGPGTLLRTIFAARPACLAHTRWVAVEISARQRAAHPTPEGVRCESLADMPDGQITGVIFGNELLDNLPFRLAVHDQGWREAFVMMDQNSHGCVEVLSAPFDPLPAGLPSTAPHGARAPLMENAATWVAEARARLIEGTVVLLDYTVPHTADLVRRPYREWLRTYRGHERGEHPLQAPGTQDITSEVPLDQLPPADRIRSQQQWLRLWGIDELVEEGRRIWAEQASQPGVEAMKMRSRISEAEALCDPGGLGGFTVMEWEV